jgi:hypothetical protein
MRRPHSSCGYHRLAVGPLPTGEALRVAHQIEEALEAAHENGASYLAVADGRRQPSAVAREQRRRGSHTPERVLLERADCDVTVT